MDIKEIKVKRCLTKSKVADYTINPYVGCQHGCRYCYATFVKQLYHIDLPWGEFCYPKINCVELLKEELKNASPGHIWLSSVTDAYQPLEGKYQLTRQILETLIEYKHKFSVEILTKSSLAMRDFDLIKQLNAELGSSMTTLDSEIARNIEPFASPPKERIRMLKEAKDSGIHVYGFISPVLPGITRIDELFKELRFCDYILIELLNTKRSVMTRLMPIIEEKYPHALDELNFYIRNKQLYYNQIHQEVQHLEEKYNSPVREIIVHTN